jgi:hypothetical protein
MRLRRQAKTKRRFCSYSNVCGWERARQSEAARVLQAAATG